MVQTSRIFLAVLCGVTSAVGAPVINEIHYRPGTAYPENTALEFIEIHNPDTAPADLSGWAITKGADFTFPAGTTIPAGGFLVVAANVTSFQAAYPSVTTVTGPWAAGATLADKGESIELSDPTGAVVDSVSYADEGDWATRTRDTLGGWSWVTGANGAGKSLERRNPLLDSGSGQNWGDSAATGGSPGAANALLTGNIAPVIRKVNHWPAVPKSAEAVTISCELKDEGAALSATLFYRNATTTSPGVFQSAAMTAGVNGYFSASLPAMSDKTIIEFYISVSDGSLTRTWPAPTSEGQNANCQYQVDNEAITGTAPAYRLVLTASENAAFASVASSSNRQFNLTFISTAGDDTTIRYRTAVRVRGMTSRNWGVRPVRISFPTDDRWNGVSDFNINSKIPYSQFIGMRCLQYAGLAGGDASPLEVRRNGVEYTVTGTNTDFGKLVRIEELNGDYIDNHWPNAPSGNVYRAEQMSGAYWISTGTAPANPDTAWNGWTKQNAHGANDWSDVMNFSTVWQNTCASHFTGATAGNVAAGTWNNVAFSDAEVTTLEAVCNMDHLARYMAVMTIIQNNEPNVTTGATDDYAAAWIEDALGRKRLHLVPHDLDNVLGKGDTPGTATGTGLYDMTETSAIFEPLLPLFGNSTTSGNAAFRAKYLLEIRKLYGSLFDADTTTNANPPFHAFLTNHLSGWVDATTLAQMKTFATNRQAHLLGLIGAAKITPAPTTSGTLATTYNGTLRINEVLSSNAAVYQNGASFPDVIELRNTGATAVDLSDMSLSDDAAVPRKFVFPSGTGIPANGFLIIHADSATTEPGLHAGFGLDAGGDSVHLYQNVAGGGGLIDEIVFGPQIADLSISRTSADPALWALTTPTVGAANGGGLSLGAVSAVRINEWAGNTDFRLNSDFIELYNTSASPASIGGAFLTEDIANSPTQSGFPALSFIGGNGRLYLDESALGFKFDASFGFLTMTGANGDLIDQVSVVSQFGDRSTGRSTDGAAAWSEFAIPSPGIANQAAPAAYQNLISQLRVTEIMADPVGGGAYEFVELQNIGATTLALDGVRLANGIDYTFPAGTNLAAGAFIVVCRDSAAFLSRYPGSASSLASGVFTGALDNSGETLALTLPSPWDVNILKFNFDPDWYTASADNGHSLTTVNQAVSLPKDWDESFTWTVSPAAGGTPGSDGPPSITSAASVAAVVGDALNYQITATKYPTGYDATNLPPGLTVNTSTGLINGTPTAAGTYVSTISAANIGGTASQTLTITVGTSGPLHHFTWNWLPGTIRANTPFAAQVTARDSAERLVSTHSGTVSLTAVSGSASFASPILITEFTDGAEDQFELQNVSNSAVNTSGWYVRINDSTTSINTVHSTQLALPASMAAGGLMWVSETNTAPRTWWGGAINWSSTGASKGWIMLFDNTNTLRDFAVWGWTQVELAGLNTTINGTTVAAAGNWTGAPSVVGTRGTVNSWQRAGSSETNSAADFQWTTNSNSFNTKNANLTIPWTTTTPLTLTPGNGTFANGVFTGYLTIPNSASSVILSATNGAGVTGSSTSFNVLTALPDTDMDGMPDSWETANGLVVGANDSSGDADGDGQSNLHESQTGTLPSNPASRFAITSSSVSGGVLTVVWNGVAGRIYQVSSSASLAGAWTPVTTKILATTDGPMNTGVATNGETKLFLRVEHTQ